MISNILEFISTKSLDAIKGVELELWDWTIMISIFWIGVALYIAIELYSKKPD